MTIPFKILAALAFLAPLPALAAEAGAVSASTVSAGAPEAAAAAFYDVPNPAPGDAPTSPTVVDANGDVLVTGSVGVPSRPVPPPASLCVASYGACELPPITGPGQVCECLVPGIGSQPGIAR